jgi:HK97 family phage prohead protease
MGKKATQPETPVWSGVVRRSLDIECRAVNEEERSIEVVASTDSLDSHGDIVEQTFNLKRYKKNPVVLWMHNAFGMFDGSTADDFLPIGRAEDVKIEGGKLTAKIVFVSGDGPESVAEKVWRRVQQRVLRAVSIGFRPGKITEEKRDGGTVFRLAENELFEISVVPIPSNPDAVAKVAEEERAYFKSVVALTDNNDSGRPAASKTAASGKDTNQMDEELKKALEARALAEKALVDEKTARENAEKQIAEQRTRADAAESALTAEKAVSEKLTSDLDKANKSIAETNEKLAKTELDVLQGVKFAPAEREELDGLVKSVGLERVKALLSKRADLALTQPVEVDGKKLNEGAPPPVVTGADASAEISNLANKAIAN